MSKKNDGGPAFATGDLLVPERDAPNGEIQGGQRGMSLRDYFAAAALAGLLANGGPLGTACRGHQERAAVAYLAADAMLAERKKK